MRYAASLVGLVHTHMCISKLPLNICVLALSMAIVTNRYLTAIGTAFTIALNI
jgi:hypothetical protein